MKLTAGYSMCKILILGLVVSSLVAEGRDFKWTRGGDWYNYFDTGSWKAGETGTNEEGVIPGEGDDDWVVTGSSANFYFDMNGSNAVIKGFTNINSWDPRNLGIRNGSLTFTSSFTNYYIRPNLYAGGKLIHAETASSRLGMSGAKSRFTVQSGAELEMYGTVYINNSDFTVQSGGKAIFDFDVFAFDKQAENLTINESQDNQGIFNSGETSFPNGLRMLPRADSSGVPPDFRIRQIAGTMKLGGDMIWERPLNTNYGRCDFYLDGGSLDIVGDVKIQGFDVVAMTEGATVSVTIAEGKTFDVSEMEFADLTTLNVSGGGVLILGDSAPAAMNLSPGIKVRFSDHVKLGDVTGYGNDMFEAVFASRRGMEIESDDSDLLAAIKTQVSVPDGWEVKDTAKSIVFCPADSKIYYITSTANNANCDYTNPVTWLIGNTPDGEPATDYPGYNDYIHYRTSAFTAFYFGLQGKKHKIRGFNLTGNVDSAPDLRLNLDRGTLEFWETMTNRRVTAAIRSNARLVIPDSCKATFEWQGAVNTFITKSTGQFDCYGEMLVGALRVTNDVGGVVNFAPKSFTLNGWGWHLVPCWFDNQGQWDFPNGLTIDSVCTYSNQLGPWSFNQRNGTMRFGGPLINNNAKHRFDFNLYGGTLKVDSDLEMGFCTNVGMPDENTTASIDVADGKTLNWTNAAFAAGTKLFKKGEGMLRLGANVPELVVSNGTLRIESAAEIASLTLSDGATFEIAASGIEIASAQLGENAVFTVDVDKVKRRVFAATLVRSEDAALLAAVKDKVSVPEDCSVEIDGNALKLVSNAGLKVIVR